MKIWQKQLEIALLEILDVATIEFQSAELQVMDVGVFPWHASIELSFLFVGDGYDTSDIADWPNYDYSKFNEGGWEAAVPVANVLNKEWESKQNIDEILNGVVGILKSPQINEKLTKFNKAPGFVVQVVNPDDEFSSNYYT